MQMEQRPRIVWRHLHRGISRQDRVRGGKRVWRLAQAPRWKRPRGRIEILGRDDHQIDVAIELQMLKPVVQHVHRHLEVMLREATSQVAIAGVHGLHAELHSLQEPNRVLPGDDGVGWVVVYAERRTVRNALEQLQERRDLGCGHADATP